MNALAQHQRSLRSPKSQYYYQLFIDRIEILWYIDYGLVLKFCGKTSSRVNWRMRILRAVYAKIVENCPVVPPEVGGILGCRDDVICEFVLDEGNSCMERAVYTPRTDFLNACIAAWSKQQIHFCGIFHSHLPWENTLSSADKAYFREVLGAMPDLISHLYFPLVLPHIRMLSFVAFRSKDGICIEKDDIEIIDQGGERE
ncbi:MAG: hypothetical protein ACI3V3_04445 [Faecousia sp.]